MTHRGDSDWHGWPLQEVTNQVAQKAYAKTRDAWPTEVRNRTPEHLAEADVSVRRMFLEAVVPDVVAVLDVVNDMPHPVVTEVRAALMRLDAAYVARKHGPTAEHRAIEEIEEIIRRYPEES